MAQQETDIDAYYKLKSKYTDKFGSLAAMTGIPADKRTQYKCIQCKKSGGTIFEETADILRATCGAEPKCDLNFVVNKNGPVILMPTLLNALREKLEREKTNLIELKIKHALGSVTDDEVLQQFESGRELLRRLSAASSSIEERLISVTDSPIKQNNINRLKAEIYGLVQSYKDNLREFSNTGRDAFLKDALEQQINEIAPLVSELRETLYIKNFVEYDINTGQYVLVQEPYTIKEMEVPFLPELKELLSL